MSKLKFVWVIMMVGLAVQAARGAFGSQKEVSMLVVPARYSVMQVAFDMTARFPIVLVSYQGDASTENPVLHAWNGHEWVPISVRDYSEGNFLQIAPKRTILVGDDKLLPPVMGSVSAWCPSVERVESIDTASMINSLAASYSFKSGDWRWFAKRYNLKLSDENAVVRSLSWYDQAGAEQNPDASSRRDYSPFQIRLGSSSKPAAQPTPQPAQQDIPAADVVRPDRGTDEIEPVPAPQPIDMEPATEPGADVSESTLPPASIQQEPAVSESAPMAPKPTIQPISEDDHSGAKTPIKPIGWEEKAVATEIPAD